MRRLPCFILLTLCTLSAAAQIDVEESKDQNVERKKHYNESREKELLNATAGKGAGKSTHAGSTKGDDSQLKDTVSMRLAVRKFPDVSRYHADYYADVTNCYGYWKGVGRPLTREQVRHRYQSIKLMRPPGSAPGSPYTHMQIVNGFGRLDNASYGPLMANPFGDDADNLSDEWESKLKSIQQFERISLGGGMVQENMYDGDGNLVLQYHPTAISQDHILGYYTDAYGCLALLRKDEECKYVSIKLDPNGYYAEVAFTDEKGHLKRNGNDAFINLSTYDKEGRVLSVMSADATGRPIIDNYGNCGWRNTYSSDGRQEFGTAQSAWRFSRQVMLRQCSNAACINQYGLPMRMPRKREDVDDVWNKRTTYDKWGNPVTLSFFDDQGRPDTTADGVHRYVATYDGHGLKTSLRAEDLNGHLVNFAKDKAMWVNRYDGKGHLLFTETRNADSLFSSEGDCLCKYVYKGDKQVLRLDYNTTNGTDTVLNYKVVDTDTCITYWNYYFKYIYVVRSDVEGRPTQKAYYDLNMLPINRNGWHKKEYTYQEQDRCCTQTERITTADGKLADITANDYTSSYNIEVWQTDTAALSSVLSRYDGDRLIERFGRQYKDSTLASSSALLFYDSIGGRGRTFKADALYYKAVPLRSPQGNTTSWSGQNEFGEPSYILDGDWDYAPLYCTNVIGDKYYYDEKGDTIPTINDSLWAFKMTLYKAICIELTDTAALSYGLRTGDIVLRYGDWHYPVPTQYGAYKELQLCLQTVRKAFEEKTMVVMRHDPATRTSRLVELHLPKGTPAQIGFIYHMIYMTEKERQRYQQVVAHQLGTVHLDSLNTLEGDDARLYFALPCKIGSENDKTLFKAGFRQNAIVVAWQVHDGDKTYFFACNDHLFSMARTNPYDSLTLHYTVDGKNVLQRVFKKADFNTLMLRDAQMSSATDIHALADSLKQTFQAAHPTPEIRLTPHQAAEQLLALPGTKVVEDDGNRFRGYDLDKYGNVSHCRYVVTDTKSLSYQQMFDVQNILEHLDYSDYYYVSNSIYYGYFKEQNSRFTECMWPTNTGIRFLTDSVDLSEKWAVIIEVTDSGLFREKYHLEGKFIVLQAGNWRFGMSGIRRLHSYLGSKGKRTIFLAPIIEKDGQYKLGPTKKITPPPGRLGIQTGWDPVPDNIFHEALKRVKRLPPPVLIDH